MFGNFRIADIVAYHCARVDIECREELRNGTLVSERDYVTALTTRMRIELARHLPLSCHAQTIDPQNENLYGVDGIIVFRAADKIKAGLFEAKRPQVTQNNQGWDYLSSRNISHFSEQIEKQRIWNGQLALWEMFFNEGQNGFQSPPYDFFGSSCVWHDNAYRFMHRESLIFNRWTTNKLKELLQTDGVNFYTIIYDMISCRAGTVSKLDKNSSTCRVFSQANDDISLNIPIPVEIGIERDERIEQFLRENKLESYIYVDLTKGEKI